MKGIICCYSGSGNTELAINYLKKRIKNVDFELYNIVKNNMPDLSKYDIVGFATFADFWGVPRYFHSFFNKMNPQPNKYSFVFNTYGFMSIKTLKSLANLAKAKQFDILIGHSLHTPESYPPMRARNRIYDTSPNQKEMDRFDAFISRLDGMLESIRTNKTPEKEKLKVGLLGTIMPAFPPTSAKKDMGKQDVDKDICKQCGTCERVCPCKAINLEPFPVFDHDKCYGCWACYNHCPEKAIYTKKFKGVGQYPKPSKELVNKLKD